MRILHVISSIDLSSGGPSKSVSDLALNQAFLGQEITIFTNVTAIPYLKESPHPNLTLHFVRQKSFKKALKSYLNEHQFDLLHGHGIWQMPVHFMAQLARKKNIPYIITPRGMLEPWSLSHKNLKKKLGMLAFQREDLVNACCIHCTAISEAENIKNLEFTNQIAVIPNGIELSEFPLKEMSGQKAFRTLLFLSRIHPKKGLEILIEAWDKIDKETRRDWRIEIIGNGEKEYIEFLNRLIKQKNLSEEIQISEPVYGAEKLVKYQNADLFVLPTYSENFGMVIIEALSCGVPVITTKGTPWEELNTQRAGWWIDIGVEPLVKALTEALSLPESERKILGQNGRTLVQRKYSIESVSTKMMELYNWILNGGEKPDFVSLNN